MENYTLIDGIIAGIILPLILDENAKITKDRKKLFKIERSDGPERITPEWWNDGLGLLETGQENARDSHLADNPSTTLQENIRDYYRVEDRQGQRFWVYREGVYNSRKQPQWYVHGIFG